MCCSFWSNYDFTHKAPQNDCLNLSFVRDELTYGKKMARNGRKMAIFNCHSFRLILAICSCFFTLTNFKNVLPPKCLFGIVRLIGTLEFVSMYEQKITLTSRAGSTWPPSAIFFSPNKTEIWEKFLKSSSAILPGKKSALATFLLPPLNEKSVL